jgi:hypothetical protein
MPGVNTSKNKTKSKQTTTTTKNLWQNSLDILRLKGDFIK